MQVAAFQFFPGANLKENPILGSGSIWKREHTNPRHASPAYSGINSNWHPYRSVVQNWIPVPKGSLRDFRLPARLFGGPAAGMAGMT